MRIRPKVSRLLEVQASGLESINPSRRLGDLELETRVLQRNDGVQEDTTRSREWGNLERLSTEARLRRVMEKTHVRK